MKNFAVLNNSIVENITCVEYTSENPAHIGLGYDGTTFQQPTKPEVN